MLKKFSYVQQYKMLSGQRGLTVAPSPFSHGHYRLDVTPDLGRSKQRSPYPGNESDLRHTHPWKDFCLSKQDRRMGSRAKKNVIPIQRSSGVSSVPSPDCRTKRIVKLSVINGKKIIILMNIRLLKFPAIRSCQCVCRRADKASKQNLLLFAA